MRAWTPRKHHANRNDFVTPRIHPPCNPKYSFPPIWSNCQHAGAAAPVQYGFFFSPNMTSYGDNFTNNYVQLWMKHVNPYDNWLLLSNTKGYTNVQSFFSLLGVKHKLCQWNSSNWDNSFLSATQSLTYNGSITFPPTLVCVSPPFMFLLTNHSTTILNCSDANVTWFPFTMLECLPVFRCSNQSP